VYLNTFSNTFCWCHLPYSANNRRLFLPKDTEHQTDSIYCGDFTALLLLDLRNVAVTCQVLQSIWCLIFKQEVFEKVFKYQN